MTVAVRGRVPRWSGDSASEMAAQHIQERLHALEVALAGPAPQFNSPNTPTFGGGGSSGGGGGGGGGGGTGTGVTDHGALTGLANNDHPQYIQHGESARAFPHQHNVDEVVGVEHRFIRRLERTSPAAHSHAMIDVVDLRPDSDQFVLASRVFGG